MGALYDRLRLPVFTDPIEAQRASVLFAIARVVLVAIVPFAALHVVGGQDRVLAAGIYLFLAAFHLLILELLHRRRVAAAGRVYVVVFFGVMVFVTAFIGGITTGHASGLITVTLFAGLCLGVRAGLVTGALAIAYASLLTALEASGRLPESPIVIGLFEDSSSIVSNIFYAMVFVTLAVKHLQSSIERVQAERERNRVRAEQGLALGRFGSRVATLRGRVELAEAAVELLRTAIGASKAAVVAFDDERLELLASEGLSDGERAGFAERVPRLESTELLSGEESAQVAEDARVVVAPIVGESSPRGWIVAVLPREADPEGAVALLEVLSAIVAASLSRERSERQLQQSQKLDVVGRLASGIAHDFNNLLTTILTSSELLERQLGSAPRQQELARYIRDAGESARLMTQQLLAFARKQPLVPERLDLNEVVTRLRPMLERSLGDEQRMSIELCGEPAWVKVDRTSVEQSLLNLTINARDAMPGGGEIRIETAVRSSERGARSEVVVSVVDEGTGIERAVLERIFEPFFTTKSDGTGLGLPTVLDAAQRAGGELRVDTRLGEGTRFELVLPAIDDGPAGSEAA